MEDINVGLNVIVKADNYKIRVIPSIPENTFPLPESMYGFIFLS